MKIKTSELQGAALDWAVNKCEGGTWESAGSFLAYHQDEDEGGKFHYSTDWAQCGRIVERENIGIWPSGSADHDGQWCARKIDTYITYSPTPLIAAMRCYVASKLGEEVDVPEELK